MVGAAAELAGRRSGRNEEQGTTQIIQMDIRAEEPRDRLAVRTVNLAAFETELEANLVDQLRAHASPLVSLVAEQGDAIVGHILFSPVTLEAHPRLTLMGLAPMAVIPARQHSGVGSALVRGGIEACQGLGADALVVLGHAEYYPRFGFVPASRFALRSEYDVPDEVFMACELRPGALHGASGTIRYHPAFADV